ncbi:MAG: hypothetical protein KJO23_04905 [Bacteroidia bacterium]|nr:hypothetical protein [Bacteroidia bacterium]NNM23721.1 hypothetical protein [Flavobacteriaceae bacterium]
MKHLILVCILLLASSCQFFETEKISSETFYEEELLTIDWADIDQYPGFTQCEAFTDKIERRDCFLNGIATSIHQHIQESRITTVTHLNDTVQMILRIDAEGQMAVKSLRIDSIMLKQIPLLPEVLEASIMDLPKVTPAYKRGIPVQTEFVMPISINTENL